MRHLKKGRKFGRERKVRKAFFKGLISALLKYERIETTEARAKEIRPQVEDLITKARKNNLAMRRLVAARIPKDVTAKLFKTIAPRYIGRPGGYTRIMKKGPRQSDSASMVIMELMK
ncbi:MAG: 50S ribosomal protein L17 [Candidatus Sungbacteria bacterium RIFCSPLOWO2_02_FULL_51_17]|uniref:Large ribosomal subunit protein bL17 n=1 Tax=Candidatus Sungbacteria bacterium RIFCSPHIGHO2_02_FULL_51_29 TaxID=1802273 RepID=A0A1G2KS04_9BACT|nr:MAG: 50S ribosomal protein L17 [Candidatus Sungbacteria bacterium RIFCSPHIGHO2_01_FULL_51_22]OHA02227.1 MAG: 50S ribosomal protein L17 [Candidatus Sungbacteria bacterium RIFCSPHIGHO2_02_FULL_51_29]OHA06052.1 MAG: 50S ribosomal protein L17 [Candidatus Sungbacteria bacterium RIFCSPLOWO2_01_FULL_51_34]OHA11256.1 MAG: 50S ribosomal protein L17 [Candidatus Sungbacteria bacterium RIFCSPLOWO2_02_FULL_51_17]